MADRYYLDCDLAPGPVDISGSEAHHLATVCRLRRGDGLTLFNGRGEEYPARVLDVGKRLVSVEILGVESPQRELGFRLEVASPLPKGDRADFLIEKLTELGAASFTPLQTTRSVVHPRETKLDRLQRHVIEASKQCGRNVLLRVRELTAWSLFCRGGDLPEWRILAHPDSGDVSLPCRGRDVVLAVGPEGGFTQEEAALGREAGWQIVSLGPRILRVETAALALAALLAIGIKAP
jgi:16S rRNA (uracil1498-N3)-methyltransferase